MSTNDSESGRLDRIERKIDSMSEAVIAIARAEEKITNLTETANHILNKLSSHDSRIRDVEQKANNSQERIRSFNAFIWTIITAVTTTIIGYLAYIVKR